VIGIAVLALVGGYFAVNAVSNTERTTTTSIPDVREIVVNVDSGSITLTGTADNQVGIGTVLRGSAFDEPVANHDLVQGVLSITASCSGPSCVVEESIAVPDGIPVSLRLRAGRVEVIDLRVPTFSGEVGSGSLVASFASAPQKIDITIGSGNVELRVPDVGYQLDVSTGTGSLDVGIPQDHSAPRSLVIRTTTGNVTVRAI
jgi:hypothetical protein